MSLLEALQKSRSKLKPTVTTVVSADGTEWQEHRTADGSFAGESNEVSNKRKKKVERLKRMGFVVDLKPDLQIALCRPSLYVGSQDVAADLTILKNTGITHILNCASNVRCFHKNLFQYYDLQILDLPETRLSGYFHGVHDFIFYAIQGGGKVFVHCNAGISRSTSFVISFMMRFDGMTRDDALATVRSVRPAAKPNEGFMKQLAEYEHELELMCEEQRIPPEKCT